MSFQFAHSHSNDNKQFFGIKSYIANIQMETSEWTQVNTNDLFFEEPKLLIFK